MILPLLLFNAIYAQAAPLTLGSLKPDLSASALTYDASRVIVDGVRLIKVQRGPTAIYLPEFDKFSPELLSQGQCAPKTGRAKNEATIARVEARIVEGLTAHADAVQETMDVLCDPKNGPSPGKAAAVKPPRPEVGLSYKTKDKRGIEQERRVYVGPDGGGMGMSF